MREILFRGKRCDNGEWVQGYYIRADHHWHKHGIHKDWITLGASANGGWFALHSKYAVKAETVGQFTGLTDKNGNNIFEGDILRYTGWVTEYDDFCYVVFDCAEFALKFVTMDKQTMGKEDLARLPLQRGLFEFCEGKNAFEIIGNIHDNPELLENP